MCVQQPRRTSCSADGAAGELGELGESGELGELDELDELEGLGACMYTYGMAWQHGSQSLTPGHRTFEAWTFEAWTFEAWAD
jgi:hypothetical protein